MESKMVLFLTVYMGYIYICSQIKEFYRQFTPKQTISTY